MESRSSLTRFVMTVITVYKENEFGTLQLWLFFLLMPCVAILSSRRCAHTLLFSTQYIDRQRKSLSLSLFFLLHNTYYSNEQLQISGEDIKKKQCTKNKPINSWIVFSSHWKFLSRETWDVFYKKFPLFIIKCELKHA